MPSRRIHLIAPAGACRTFTEALGFDSSAQLVKLVQDVIGDRYRVTADHAILEAGEDERLGGRGDDGARVHDINMALADGDVAAVVALRGGAWMVRLIPRIDFSALERRAAPVALFGFSELTPLVNIVAGYRQGRGIYDMGPAFLGYGLRRYAAQLGYSDPSGWAKEQLRPQFEDYLRDVVGMIEGRGTTRSIEAKLLRGALPSTSESIRIAGGNLTVLSTMVGTPWDAFIRPRRRWLMLEDFNDKLERVDRFLAHLTLAGYWEDCPGLLLGDFHQGDVDQRPAVLELLEFHLPRNSDMPVLTTGVVGHTWPMSPLPLNTPLRLMPLGDGTLRIAADRASVRTVED